MKLLLLAALIPAVAGAQSALNCQPGNPAQQLAGQCVEKFRNLAPQYSQQITSWLDPLLQSNPPDKICTVTDPTEAGFLGRTFFGSGPEGITYSIALPPSAAYSTLAELSTCDPCTGFLHEMVHVAQRLSAPTRTIVPNRSSFLDQEAEEEAVRMENVFRAAAGPSTCCGREKYGKQGVRRAVLLPSWVQPVQ